MERSSQQDEVALRSEMEAARGARLDFGVWVVKDLTGFSRHPGRSFCVGCNVEGPTCQVSPPGGAGRATAETCLPWYTYGDATQDASSFVD